MHIKNIKQQKRASKHFKNNFGIKRGTAAALVALVIIFQLLLQHATGQTHTHIYRTHTHAIGLRAAHCGRAVGKTV